MTFIYCLLGIGAGAGIVGFLISLFCLSEINDIKKQIEDKEKNND